MESHAEHGREVQDEHCAKHTAHSSMPAAFLNTVCTVTLVLVFEI